MGLLSFPSPSHTAIPKKAPSSPKNTKNDHHQVVNSKAKSDPMAASGFVGDLRPPGHADGVGHQCSVLPTRVAVAARDGSGRVRAGVSVGRGA
jgi:hypothetical protein